MMSHIMYNNLTRKKEIMMFIIVDSLTGLSLRFAKKLGYPVYQIDKDDIPFDQGKFFLITRSFNFGEIPISTIRVLRKHYLDCIGVAVSGNRNWGTNYGAAGDKIQDIYKIPLVLKFEGSGFEHEIEIVKKYIEERDDE